MIRLQRIWQNETAFWILCTLVAVLFGTPLIFKAIGEARSTQGVLVGVIPVHAPTQASKAPKANVQPNPQTSLQTNPQANPLPVVPLATVGQAALDLNLLSRTFAPDEADNLRWSLIRRTPAAAQVYSPDSGVNWDALRQLSGSGTILLLAGSDWSFNETFQEGPGYKVADGILAGGQCSLATIFNAAAIKAGLPSEWHRHSVPIPGFAWNISVDIYWGSDDLIIHNNTGKNLAFVWSLTANSASVKIITIDANKSFPLPDWRNQTIAMIYGHPAPGGWGSIGQADIADGTLYLARNYASQVSQWNGGKPTVIAINPNVAMTGNITDRPEYFQYLINEARRQGYYVMLDVQTDGQDPLALFNTLMSTYLQENVWFDWDIEHTDGGSVDAKVINQVAQAYFSQRQKRGYTTPGIFGLYVFSNTQITNPQDIKRQYAGGSVVPIFDGYGGSGSNPAQDKIDLTKQVLSLFGNGPFGIMEFQTLWNDTYDKISAQDYFNAFPNTQIMAGQ